MAMIVDASIPKLLALLSDLAKEEVALLWGVPAEIEKLQRTLRRLDKLVASAERKRAVDEAVEDWIRELKDCMYDAEDILDDCRIEAERSSGEAQLQSRRRFSHLFSCFCKAKATHEMGTRISVLNGRLEEIYKARSDLGLEVASGRSSSPSPFPGGNTNRMVGPVVDSDITGDKIHEDTEKLVSLLITNDTGRSALNLNVVAIVGAGGIGKTTLAQNVYNNLQIKSYFSELRMWVCVSQEFNEEELLREIISSGCGGGDASLAHSSRAQLEPKVVDILRGKRLILVLDDVWDDVKVWDDLLRKLFVSCASGSRILVTTRNENVARGMEVVCSHRVDLLPMEDGWSLLCKKAFGSSVGEEADMERLKQIGMEIVQRCGGLPLAIKALGGVLRKKDMTRKAWEDVLRSSAWDVTGLPEGVKAALYLSYDDLPSPLKQCFTYCSLFPEDYTLLQRFIVGLWMAEGFVKEEGGSSIEDVAEGYYRELMQRNLLQPIGGYYNQSACKMHDLLRSLAQSLTQDESLFAKGGVRQRVAAPSTTMKLRRLSIHDCKAMEEFAQAVRKHQSTSLRTLLLLRNTMDNNLLHSLLPSVLHLRVLNLERSRISCLPDSLGDLVHLRLLDVSLTPLQALPESIGNLTNLQSLDITGCDQLSSLPKGIMCLHNLRHLGIQETGVVGIPSGISRLRNLSELSGFILRQDQDQDGVGEWSVLEDLEPLLQLKTLGIENLHNVVAIEEAKKAALESKRHLTDLELYFWKEGHQVPEEQVFSEEETERMEKVLEELCPPPCIDDLTIDCYIGRALPPWMSSTPALASYLSCLRRLNLVDCINCEQLPSLGLLPCLDYLDITGFRRVVTIGHEFMYSSNDTRRSTAASSQSFWFPKLTVLHLWNMPNWEEWQWGEGTPAMPRLEKLFIDNSPKLTKLPMGLERHATALKLLDIEDASILRAVGSHPSLEELRLKGTPNLQSVSNLPSLKFLKLWDYPDGSLPEWMPSINPRVHVTWH